MNKKVQFCVICFFFFFWGGVKKITQVYNIKLPIPPPISLTSFVIRSTNCNSKIGIYETSITLSNNVESVYVGMTMRKLLVKIKEYRRDIKQHKQNVAVVSTWLIKTATLTLNRQKT